MDLQINKSIEKCIESIETDDCLLSKEKLVEFVKQLRIDTAKIGLSSSQLLSVCRIACSSKFNRTIVDQLIKCMIPRESIPEDIALLIVSKLGSSHLHLSVQSHFLRWLLLVFELIADKKRLHCLYGVIFHFVEYDQLCPLVCHLLFLLTRKCDVTHYRITRLTSLQSRIGPQPFLCGLFSVYKLYQPAMLSMSGGFKTFFKKNDRAMEQAIISVQQRFGLSLANEQLAKSAAYNILPQVTNSKQEPLFPSLQPSMLHEAPTKGFLPKMLSKKDKVPIHHLNSFEEILENFVNLDLNCQTSSLLNSSDLQHIVAVTSDQTVAVRLSFWLSKALQQEILVVTGETDRGKKLLETLLGFTRLLQECLPVCESFLFKYLCMWNGSDYRTQVMKLITTLRFLPYQVLYDFVLSPLYKLYTFSPSVYFKCSIVAILSQLLSNYLSFEINKHERLLSMQNEGIATSEIRLSFVSVEAEPIDVVETVSGLVRFVGRLCEDGLQVEGNHLSLHYHSLRFYTQVSRIYLDHARPIVVLPPKSLFRKSMFSLNSQLVASFTRILFNYRSSIEEMKKANVINVSHQEGINHINQFLLDCYDTLWRRRSFHPHCQGDSVLFQGLDSAEVDKFISNLTQLPSNWMFSVDRHPAFVFHASEYLLGSGRSASEALSGEFVLEEGFMKHLATKGLSDVTDLIERLRSAT